jgi:von Willebrand factor type A domain/PQQ-like domain
MRQWIGALGLGTALFMSALPAPAQAPILPGRGLAQHDFLYAGEAKEERIFIVRKGEIVWSYTHPGKGEISDAVLLPNGNILFAHQFAITEVTPDRKVIWNYDAPPGTETHTAQLIGAESVVFIQNGDPAKAVVMNKKTGDVEHEFTLPVKNPRSVHGQFRRARLTGAGNLLVAHMDLGKVVEYDLDGKPLWSVDAPGVWSANPLPSGNVLIVAHKYVREVNRKGETVWEFSSADAPEYQLSNMQTATRLESGNTLINDWFNEWSGKIDPANAPAQAIEVTPDKKIVWALRSWNPPADLGPSTTIQILDALAGGSAGVPTFHTGVSLVKVDAYVYDRQTHAPIVDLSASDFTIYDDDEPREIAYFANDSGALDLLFLLDVSGSVREILPQVANCAADALSVFETGDRAAVMAFTRTTALTQPLTADFRAAAQGIRVAMALRIGLDTDINQALWSAADYLHGSGGAARRVILILTDNMQETRIPDSLVDEQLSEAGAVLDGLLLRGPVALPHVTHPGILGFARNTGGEVIEGNRPAARLAEMIRRIKFRYSIHFRPVESSSPRPRRIRVELTAEARRRYPNAVVRARRIYFPRGTYRPKRDIPAGQKVASTRACRVNG